MRTLCALLLTSLAALATGCFSPTIPEGNPCAPGGLCPDGLSCINQVCISQDSEVPLPDAGPIVDGPNMSPDLDKDGVLNAADNCPTIANATQHDEDLDAVGDVCDNCPHVANKPQANADADGVGDVCDPRPVTAGDKISLFLGFDQPLPAGVTTVGGVWMKSATGDTYQQTSTDPDVTAALLIEGIRDGFTMEVGGKVQGISNNFVWLTTTFGEAAGSNRYFTCGVIDFKNPNDSFIGIIEEYNGNGYQELDSSPTNNLLANNAAVKIVAQIDSAARSISCTTTDPRGTGTNIIPQATGLVPGRVAVRSNGVAYALNYIVVIGRQ